MAIKNPFYDHPTHKIITKIITFTHMLFPLKINKSLRQPTYQKYLHIQSQNTSHYY